MSPLTVRKDGKGELAQLDRKLWLTADREQVVEDGDPRAAFLLGGEGDELPAAEAARLGITSKAAEKQSAPAEDKQSAPAEDKQAPAPANKAVTSAKKR